MSASPIKDHMDRIDCLDVTLVRPKAGKKHRKILTLSDMHIPFHNKVLIDEAFKAHADADILVLNGDIIDCYSVSSYDKFTKIMTLMQEYAVTLDFIKKCSEKFPQVVLIEGNHEWRIQRFMARHFDAATQILAASSRLAPDGHILKGLAEGNIFAIDGKFVGSYDFKNVSYSPSPYSWFAKIGKTLFIHPYRGKSLATQVLKTATFTGDMAMLNTADYDALVVGHTHQTGKVIRDGRLLIEQGCLTLPQDYALHDFGRPMHNGYAVIYQDRQGNTLFDESNFVYQGYQILEKPALID